MMMFLNKSCSLTVFYGLYEDLNYQNGFRRNQSTISQIFTIHWIREGVCVKTLQATLLFINFPEAFDSILKGKMEQILLAYGLPKETVAAIMMLYKNMKVKVHSLDGDTEYFDIVAGVLPGNISPIPLYHLLQLCA